MNRQNQELGPDSVRGSPPILKRLSLKNFRSIAECDVALGQFTVIVGKNGAGKSNFLDSLRFVSEALNQTLEHAIRYRGGFPQVRRRTKGSKGGRPRILSVGLTLHFPKLYDVDYNFTLDTRSGAEYYVKEESCRISYLERGRGIDEFLVADGQLVKGPADLSTRVQPNSLYLQAVSGSILFGPVFDALSSIGVYNLNPEVIREYQTPVPSKILLRDGSNLAGILHQIQEMDRRSYVRLSQHLNKVTPGIERVEYKAVGNKETIEFHQVLHSGTKPHPFPAASMSDGTLRALGILVALHQDLSGAGSEAMLIGIEEPETALHPQAAMALSDALLEASNSRQVLVSSHSADMLENPALDPEGILVVVSRNGQSIVAPASNESKDAIRNHLFTGGELLRGGQLEPEQSVLDRFSI